MLYAIFCLDAVYIGEFCIFQQVYAFWAPKIIGGVNAPTPVGELGMNQMTQAIDLIDVSYEQVNCLCSSSIILVYVLNQLNILASCYITLLLLHISFVNFLSILHIICFYRV